MMMSDVIMELIVNEGRNRDSYPSAVPRETSKAFPDYHGGLPPTIPFASGTQPASITVDPDVRGGIPCVGQRPIAHILESLASSGTFERAMQNYPDLTPADIQLALETAAWVMRDPAINWSELDLLGMVDFRQEFRAWQSLTDDALGSADNPSSE
jgi:uncharacterized protein (DUF433 family)